MVSTALTVREAFDLTKITSPVETSWLIRWVGFRDLGPQYHTVDGKRKQIPVPDRRDDEENYEYIVRIWDDLHDKLKALSVKSGLQRGNHYSEGMRGGMQYLVFKTYQQGWWIETMEGDGGDTSWREWVRDTITMEGQSTSEASQLANTILNLWFLSNNQYAGLPHDLEDIFKDRTIYNRWRRVTGKLRHLIEIADEAEEPADVDKKIQEIIDAVNDPEKTQPDLDEVGKQGPKMPPIVLKESGRDRYGRHVIEGVVYQAGMKFLQRKLGKMFKLELVGEAYDTDKHRVVTYRERLEWVCDQCGSVLTHNIVGPCPECGMPNIVHRHALWSRQVEGEEDWEGLGEQPPMTGHYAGERVDTELGLRYVDYYEEVNDEEL